VVLSGEYSHEDGIPAGGFGEAAANGRTWYNTDTLINRGINPGDGGPQYLYRQHVQSYQYTKYGLISAGPLQGIAFDKNGNPFNFNYGSNGVPARNAAGNVSNCYGGFCVGGDLSGNVGIGTSLQSEITRWDGYGRIGFDIDSNNEIYGTLNVSRVASNNTPNPGAAKTGLTMQCSNPFVPASVQAMCTTAGITSFSYGVSNAVLPDFINVNPVRRQIRGVVGAKGKLDVLGTNWSYDGYYEHGENITDIHVSNMTLNNRYSAAIQAVRQPDGTITCASAVAVASAASRSTSLAGRRPARRRWPTSRPPTGLTSTPARRRMWSAWPSTASLSRCRADRCRSPSVASTGMNITRSTVTPMAMASRRTIPTPRPIPPIRCSTPRATTGMRAIITMAPASMTSTRASSNSTCRCSTVRSWARRT
jgi:hypothetical protein